MNKSARLRGYFCALFILFFAPQTPNARASALSPSLDRGPIPDVTVSDQANHQISLRTQLQAFGHGPIILLPVYTRCMGSCPVLAQKLSSELARMQPAIGYRVLLFSFDPGDTAESLQQFRKRERLPDDWVFVRADQNEIRKFLDFFRFSVMKQNGALIHPNELFLLADDADGNREYSWRSTLAGLYWTSSDLEKALKEIHSPTLIGRLKMNPQFVAKTGFAGLLGSLTLLVAWLIFRRRSTPGSQTEGLESTEKVQVSVF